MLSIWIYFNIFILVSLKTPKSSRLPVIIDTDLGSDNDDAFAIAYVLNSKENLEVKLITTCHQNTTRRAKIVANLLKKLNETNIPLGIGIETDYNPNNSSGAGDIYEWARDFNLSSYPHLYTNGIEKMLEVINQYSSSNPINILCIGPLSNIGYLVEKYPEVTSRIRIFLMGGSVYKGYQDLKKIPEYNIVMNITGAQKVFNAKYASEIVVTPLDTSSWLQIYGHSYDHFLSEVQDNCEASKALFENYVIWYLGVGKEYSKTTYNHYNPTNSSSPMFDVQAAISLNNYAKNVRFEDDKNLNYEKMFLTIADNGTVIVGNKTDQIHNSLVSTSWKSNDSPYEANVKSLSEDIVSTLLKSCKNRK